MYTLSRTKTTQVIVLCAALAAMAGCGKGKSTVPTSDDSRFEKVAETNIVKACMLKYHHLWPWFGARADDLRPTQEKLQEFADVLNAQTWNEFDDIRDDRLFRRLDIIKYVHLPGVDDPLIFIKLRNYGTYGGATIYILRRDPQSGKWRNKHHNEDGSGFDKELFPVDIGGRTRFVNEVRGFKGKLSTAYSVLDYNPETDEWPVVGEIGFRHTFRLSEEDLKWISHEQVSEIVLGKREYDSGKIPFGDKTIEIEKFEIENGFLPDGYCLRVLDSGQAVWPGNDYPPALVLGFLPVERDDGHFIVMLDCERIQYLLRVKIKVLDIKTLRILHEHVAKVDSFTDY